MKRTSLALAVGLVAALAAAGCSSSSNNTCSAYSPPAGTVLQQPVISFAHDVVPIFVLSCAFDSCHGAAHGDNNGVYLGSKTGDPGAAKIYAAIVSVPANEAPSLSYVAPGDTGASYLLHKIDGDNCTLASKCTSGDCQSTMPQGNALLPVETRDVVRRWIAQGAQNN